MVVHGSVKSSQPVKRNADGECVFVNFTGILNEYIEQKDVKRLLTYVYSIGKPNSWQTDNQRDRKWMEKEKFQDQ